MDLREEKRGILNDVMTKDVTPSRIPLFLNLQGWIVYHGAGYGYEECVYNSDKLISAYEKAFSEYPADLYYDTGGFAFMGFSKLLGSEDYYLNEEKYSMNFKDICYLAEDEQLKLLASDPKEFLWNQFYVKKFKNLAYPNSAETISAYLSSTGEHFEKVAEMKVRVEKTKGCFFLSDVPMYQPAFDYLFQYIIGMKGISMAMRRKSDLLISALDGFEELFGKYMDELTPPLSLDMPFQNQICLLGQTITNPRQFGPFIWNYMKKRIDKMAQQGKIYFMVEGAGSALLDTLEDIPKGVCALHIEKDELRDLVSRFSDRFTYVGGMPVSLLGSGTAKECCRYAERLMDEYGPSGNYIFSTDKGIVFETDAKPENLKALCKKVSQHRSY